MEDTKTAHEAIAAKSAAALAVQVVHASFYNKVLETNCEVFRDKQEIEVIATNDIAVKSLVVPVAVFAANSLVAFNQHGSKHPRAASLQVKEKESVAQGTAWPALMPPKEFLITPDLHLPKTLSVEGEAQEWKLQDRAHLFWLIPRSCDEATWNCEIFHIELTMANAVAVPGQLAVARAFQVSVPALHNTRPIKKGSRSYSSGASNGPRACRRRTRKGKRG